jgi:hypothetical protein
MNRKRFLEGEVLFLGQALLDELFEAVQVDAGMKTSFFFGHFVSFVIEFGFQFEILRHQFDDASQQRIRRGLSDYRASRYEAIDEVTGQGIYFGFANWHAGGVWELFGN